MKAVALLFLLASTACPSDKIQIQRDGAQWLVTVSRSLPAQSLDRIVSMGDLTVRGRSIKNIRYTIAQRLSTDEATARRVSKTLRAQIAGGQLTFEEPASVRIEVPRKSRFMALGSVAGMIDAADIDGSVRADTAAGRITLDRIAGDVDIHSSGGATSLGSIGGVVRCHSGGGTIRAVLVRGQSLFETDGGDIHLGDMMGAVRAITAAGGIRIDQAGAEVFADTLGGPISIVRALGLVIANSGGGPIEIGDAPSVRCQSRSGTIRLNNVSGSLRAVTGHGSIIAEILPGHPLENSVLSTRNGDITVFIPSDTGVTIHAETSGSRNPRSIVSDYSGLRTVARGSSVVATGRINGGGPLLRLTGAGGRIEIKRR